MSMTAISFHKVRLYLYLHAAKSTRKERSVFNIQSLSVGEDGKMGTWEPGTSTITARVLQNILV